MEARKSDGSDRESWSGRPSGPATSTSHIEPEPESGGLKKRIFGCRTFARIFFGYGKDTDSHHPTKDVPWWEYHVPVNPSSPFSQGWEFTSGILLLYTTAVTPLLISFFTEEEGWCQQAPTINMDMMVDLFFILEIIVHFITGAFHQGQYIYKANEVIVHYMRNGSFPTDVITACPVAWLEFFLVEDLTCDQKALLPPGSNADTGFVQYMRLVRMLRMLRLLKVLKIFNVLRDLFRLRPTIIRLLKLAFTVVMIAHIGGCAWWFLKQLEGHDAMVLFKDREGIINPIISPYIISLYFMMATLCTVGYGDISAETDAERVFITIVMLMGSAVFAIIVSNMSALVSSIQSSETEHMEQMEDVLTYMRANGVSRDLQLRVQSYYNFICKQRSTVSISEDILSDLPVELTREIRMSLNHKLLSEIPFLSKMSDDFVSDLFSKLVIHLVLPGELIYSAGSAPSAMYIVISGSINLISQDPVTNDKQVEVLNSGSVFGEESLFLNQPHKSSAKTEGFCELYELSADDFDVVMATHPESHRRIHKVMRARWGMFDETHASIANLDVDAIELENRAERNWAGIVKKLIQKYKCSAEAWSFAANGMSRLAAFSTTSLSTPTRLLPYNEASDDESEEESNYEASAPDSNNSAAASSPSLNSSLAARRPPPAAGGGNIYAADQAAKSSAISSMARNLARDLEESMKELLSMTQALSTEEQPADVEDSQAPYSDTATSDATRQARTQCGCSEALKAIEGGYKKALADAEMNRRTVNFCQDRISKLIATTKQLNRKLAESDTLKNQQAVSARRSSVDNIPKANSGRGATMRRSISVGGSQKRGETRQIKSPPAQVTHRLEPSTQAAQHFSPAPSEAPAMFEGLKRGGGTGTNGQPPGQRVDRDDDGEFPEFGTLVNEQEA